MEPQEKNPPHRPLGHSTGQRPPSREDLKREPWAKRELKPGAPEKSPKRVEPARFFRRVGGRGGSAATGVPNPSSRPYPRG